MTARCYSSHADEDFVFPPGEATVKIKVQCRCGVRGVPLRMAEAALSILRQAKPDPDLVCASSWCRDCKTLSKVTARALHLA